MSELPPPIRLFGEPALLDDDARFGAEEAAQRLTDRLGQVQPAAVRPGRDGTPLLSPPFSVARDHVAGPVSSAATLVVFGAFGTPASRPLGRALERVRERHMATLRVAWRHYPDAGAHPHAVMLALAAEAAAARGRFWALARELLRLRHDDPRDLHVALVRAGLDPDLTLDAMRAGTGADRIADDVASALGSGVAYSPALFLDGERYEGELDDDALSAAVLRAIRGASDRRGPAV